MGDEKSSVRIRLPGMPSAWPTVQSLVHSGASSLLPTFVLLPMDLIKVRIQSGQGSMVQVTKSILKNEGFAAFHKGFSTALLRHATSGFARSGSYKLLTGMAIVEHDGKRMPSYQIVLCLQTSFAIAAFVASPADLALTRIQADATFPASQRRNYTNVFNAHYRIAADEGVLALWKGLGPNLLKSIAIPVVHAPLLPLSAKFFKKNLGLRADAAVLGTSIVLAFGVSVCVLPLDYVKTQIQIMQPDAKGKYPYTGSFDCALKTMKSGGLLKFYAGFPAYFVKSTTAYIMLWFALLAKARKTKNSTDRSSMR